MKKRKGWKSKLSKAQLRHIKETTDNCLLREFKANRATHWKWLLAGNIEDPCIECRLIALRLRIE